MFWVRWVKVVTPPRPYRMMPFSFLVLKDSVISESTSNTIGLNSTKPGREKLTVWTFCRMGETGLWVREAKKET